MSNPLERSPTWFEDEFSQDLRVNGLQIKDGTNGSRVITHSDLPPPLDLSAAFKDPNVLNPSLQSGSRNSAASGAAAEPSKQDSKRASKLQPDEPEDKDRSSKAKKGVRTKASEADKGKKKMTPQISTPSQQVPRLAMYLLDLERGVDTAKTRMEEPPAAAAAEAPSASASTSKASSGSKGKAVEGDDKVKKKSKKKSGKKPQPVDTPLLKKLREWEQSRRRVAKFDLQISNGKDPVLVL